MRVSRARPVEGKDLLATSTGQRLHELHVAPLSYATRWYLTVFAYTLPHETQLRIWDVLMLEGISILTAASLALLETLRFVAFDDAMEQLTSFFPIQAPDDFMNRVRRQMKQLYPLQSS